MPHWLKNAILDFVYRDVAQAVLKTVSTLHLLRSGEHSKNGADRAGKE